MAISAPRDNNRVVTVLGTLNTDGITPISVLVDASTHRLATSDGTTGTDFGRRDAVRDANRIPVWIGVSSADGITPIEIYTDSSGNLLTQST